MRDIPKSGPRLYIQATNFSLQERRTTPINQSSATHSIGSSRISPNTTSTTLSDVFQSNCRLLSPSEKAASQFQDPTIDLLYQSRAFISFMLYISLSSLVPMVLAFVWPVYRFLYLVMLITILILNLPLPFSFSSFYGLSD